MRVTASEEMDGYLDRQGDGRWVNMQNTRKYRAKYWHFPLFLLVLRQATRLAGAVGGMPSRGRWEEIWIFNSDVSTSPCVAIFPSLSPIAIHTRPLPSPARSPISSHGSPLCSPRLMTSTPSDTALSVPSKDSHPAALQTRPRKVKCNPA